MAVAQRACNYKIEFGPIVFGCLGSFLGLFLGSFCGNLA